VADGGVGEVGLRRQHGLRHAACQTKAFRRKSPIGAREDLVEGRQEVRAFRERGKLQQFRSDEPSIEP